MASLLEQSASDVTLTSLGQKGAILITDTTAITGTFRAIKVLSDTVFSVLTSDITKNGTVTLAVGADFGTVEAGQELLGKITAVTLTSGKVILYK